jgi:glycosyltransferase involved in cell wall biosynthesis
MRILMVNKFLHPNGGSETYVFQLGNRLKELGHAVEYFGMEHQGRIVGNHMECYVTNVDFHQGGIKKLLYPLHIIYSVEARRKLKPVLKDFEPDVVHLNNFNFQLTPSIIYEVSRYVRKTHRQVRLVYTAHDYQLVCPNHMLYRPAEKTVCEQCLGGNFLACIRGKCIHGSLSRSFLGALESCIYSRLGVYRQLDVVICPSSFMANKLNSSRALMGKLVTLRNFVQAQPIQGKKDEYVLYFGRLSEEKGIRTLISAVRMLPHIPFVFAGTGPLEGELRNIPNLQAVGYQTGDELLKLIHSARFSICPSEWFENCPFSVMESQVQATPVLGANIGGIPELIEEGEGMLFESGNTEDLSAKIDDLWKNREKTDAFSQRLSTKNSETIDDYIIKLMEIYNAVSKVSCS